MTPIQPDVLRRKLAVIVQNLKALEPVAKLKVEPYRKDLFRRKGTERLLQELIEAAIDINIHIITQLGQAAPDDYYQSFIKLVETEVLPMSLARQLAPSAGLRNRLVHEYDEIDDSIVLKAVVNSQQQYPLYIKAVEDYLKRFA
ncbi:MAG: DUF86 domain-containing protein [Nitrospirae bacterium]|nr:DUF86 domain-containing protein [Nitrospirota bacterium]